MAKCCICERYLEREDGPVLSMGAGGNPRLLCEECEHLLDTATEGCDFEEIENAMDRLGKLMADGNPDRVTFSVVNGLMQEASERAKAIKDGNYDFSLDEREPENEGFDEIPEELLESEEDKRKDEIEEKKMKKFDKVYNILMGVLLTITVLALTWKLFDTFSPNVTASIRAFFDFAK